MNQKTLPFVRPALLLSLVSLPVVSQAALTQVNLAGASNTLSGTSTQGSTITIATTDSGFSTTNFGTVDNPLYTVDYGTLANGVPHSSTAGGMATINYSNSLVVPGETVHLLIYDVDLGDDGVVFNPVAGSTEGPLGNGAPAFLGGVDATIIGASSADPVWTAATNTLSFTNTVGNPNTNVAIFDITGISSLAWDDFSSQRPHNFAVFSMETIPEPSRALLLLCGVVGMVLRRRRG